MLGNIVLPVPNDGQVHCCRMVYLGNNLNHNLASEIKAVLFICIIFYCFNDIAWDLSPSANPYTK